MNVRTWAAGIVLGATVLGRGADVPRDFTKESAEQKAARMAWFTEARFGMFIHWGLYAIPAGEWNGKEVGGIGEWIRHSGQIPLESYDRFAGQFNPTAFDAGQWAALMKKAGMKYVVITSKHHDGFALWDSKVSDFDVMAAPFKRDILRELSEACRRQGVRFCTYHSIMDWHHPDYLPRREWENDRPTAGADYERFVGYLKAQLKEIVTGYGPLGILWFDGEWEETWTHARGVDLYNYVRSLQPDIIVNNRVDKGRQGMQGMNAEGDFAGDYGTPEQEVPSRGFGQGVYWESCMTMNDTWGFKKNDHNWKSVSTLVRMLVDVASKGGNLLLNVGPRADGTIPPESVERLEAVGRWMAVNRESIHGTSATPFRRLPWRCTAKPGRLYVHVFDWPADRQIALPGLKNTVTSARLLAAPAEALKMVHEPAVVRIELPAQAPDAVDSVLAVDLEGMPEAEDLGLTQAADGSLALAAADAEIHGSTLKYEEGGRNLGFWLNDQDWAEWRVRIDRPGTFQIEVEAACDPKSAGARYAVSVVDQSVGGTLESTGGWDKYAVLKPGRITIPEKGEYRVAVKGRKTGEAVMNLRTVRFAPASE